jgi:hypothetical protein
MSTPPPDPDPEEVEVRATNGGGEIIAAGGWRTIGYLEDDVNRASAAFARMAEALEALPRLGIEFERNTSPFWNDPRQGEEVYVYDLLPGTRVYILEDVFTVDRVDMNAPLPTVWLKELPTSPLYFTEDEYIYLANETEDQP